MPKTTKSFAEAIRAAIEREGVGPEEYRRRHGIPSAHFYKLLRGRNPVPAMVLGPLLKLKAAGVRHPLLDLVG